MLKRLLTITYGVTGIIVGSILLWYMSPHLYKALDNSFTRNERDIRMIVLSSKMTGMYKNREYKVTLQDKKPSQKTITVSNEKFFNYVQRKMNPPYSLVVDITLSKQWLSGKTIVISAAAIKISHRKKNSKLVLFLILTILGGAIIFAAIKDSYKRCIQIRRDSWAKKHPLLEKTSSEEND